MHKDARNNVNLTKQQKSVEFANRILKYLISLGKDLDFINHFYGLNISQNDIRRFKDFLKVIKLKAKGYSLTKTSMLVGVPKDTIAKWVFNKSLPFLVRIFQHYIQLGDSKDKLWLSVNSTKGGLFTGPWILVPDKIIHYDDVLFVINQLKPINECKIKHQFDLKSDNLKRMKPNFFAYLLGILVGDASKVGIKRKRRTTRRISLSLTRTYPTNERLGDFVSLCANYLGLRMTRIKDGPKGSKNKNSFFRWSSQSSPLIEWIFNVCLGLNDDQLTTYDAIKADWILTAPKTFRIWFLQGLADSDGFVDLQAQQIGIITQPNTDLIERIFKSLGVNSRKRIFSGRLEGLMINIRDAYKLPIFNPLVRSYRFELLEKLVKAKRIRGRWPKWLSDKVDTYIRSGLQGTQIVKRILNEFNIAIRTKQIYKRQKGISHEK